MAAPFKLTPQLLKLQEVISQGAPSTAWDTAWLTQTTPWDVGHIQPPLEEILRSEEIDFPRNGRALVPGCGKGYDAIFIASSLGLQTTGVDISPTAITLANETLRKLVAPPSNVSFENKDFFDMKDGQQFDLVYDYTFFQALPPGHRRQWGAQMCNIIKPGGYLIILAYPTNALKDVGPPYGIDENSHEVALGNDWDKLVDRVPEVSSEPHKGEDRLMVWRKKVV